MTLAQAKDILRPMGVTVTRRVDTDEYRVNLAGGGEETAYYATDLDDAVGTGRAMAAHNRVHDTSTCYGCGSPLVNAYCPNNCPVQVLDRDWQVR